MSRKNASYPVKASMNLYYKVDRTKKPATVALYVLFVLAILLGAGRFLVYDLWVETENARERLNEAQDQLETAMTSLADYEEVKMDYQRYSATEEEAANIDRMEVLSLLDTAVGSTAEIGNISISGSTAQVQFSSVTLAHVAEIVKRLEDSPIVAGTVVNTASTTGDSRDLVSASILLQLQKEAAEE